MPKVRELGVTVVPEGFGPVGIGGGGCGVTNPCLLCTQNVTVCGGFSQWACARITLCTDCTTQAFSICGTTPNRQPQAGLTQESIRQLRAQMQQQLAALDEVEKNLGPKTEEEIAARENELQQELERLRARREELKNKNE